MRLVPPAVMLLAIGIAIAGYPIPAVAVAIYALFLLALHH